MIMPITELVTFFQVYSSSFGLGLDAVEIGRSRRNHVPSGLISKDLP